MDVMKTIDRKKIYVFFFLTVFCRFFVTASGFYWSQPEQISLDQGKFPVSDFNDRAAVIVWQEHKDNEKNNTYLSSLYISSSGEQNLCRFFAGPFSFAGEEPSLSSVVVDSSGTVFAVAPVDSEFIGIYRSVDGGKTYSETLIDSKNNRDAKNVVAPRIYNLGKGGYIILAARGGGDVLSIYFSISEDGINWSEFKPFPPAENLGASFLPVHLYSGGKDYIVFQSMYMAERATFQLYSAYSSDKGKTWSEPVIITDFNEPFGEKRNLSFDNFDNQRPFPGVLNGLPYIVWERTFTGGKTEIYGAPFTGEGIKKETVEKISSGYGRASNPVIADSLENPVVVWYDDRTGENSIYISQKNGVFWEESETPEYLKDCIFPCPVVVGSDLFLYYQKGSSGVTGSIMELSPDKFVDKPVLQAVNFTAGKGINSDTPGIEIIPPEDSAGISGFSWILSRSESREPPLVISNFPDERNVTGKTTEDGSWFFAVKVRDEAGNWSETARIEFVRDTTPPEKPVLELPGMDEKGFFLSNTFSLKWSRPEPDISGYSYSLEYLGSLDFAEKILDDYLSDETSYQAAFNQAVKEGRIKEPVLPSRIISTLDNYSVWNIDNGLYAFSVAAIDSAGNIGPAETKYLLFNKYIPYTTITAVDGGQDKTGILNLTLVGKGFASDGFVSSVFLDRDGELPWDYELNLSNGDYDISSDKIISGISIPDMEEGDYFVILNHSTRGIYKSSEKITVVNYGTVKFGDYIFEYNPSWQVLNQDKSLVYAGNIVFYVFIGFIVLGILFGVHGIVKTLVLNANIKNEIFYLLGSGKMAEEKKRHISNISGYKFGLRLKLTFFTGILVMGVVLLVSIPLGRNMIKTQEESLVTGLEVKTKVLLESIASGARIYLPSKNVLELGFLPEQSRAMEEALSATVTGFGAAGTEDSISYVWATNDENILDKINTPEYEAGESVMTDELSGKLEVLRKELNLAAEESVGDLSSAINDLTREGIGLVQGVQTELARKRLQDIQNVARNLEEQLNQKLNEISQSSIGSWPVYPEEKFDRDVTDYIFYKPVLYRAGESSSYVQGIVRVEISTASALETLSITIRTLVFTTAVVALLAIAIGIGGALILASVIVSPLIKLVSHVEKISATEDKEKLEGQDIIVKSRDEIGLLGNTINEMTHGLVKAAAASKDLSVGKEIQKMFLPLETDEKGTKLSTGILKEKNISFFGYYEGAKGVSGDYFDYIRLDDRYYAVIKCDIAGKGVSAALIMVEVATLFQNYFKTWNYSSEGLKIDRLVSLINDTIESRGFNGRFAAFTLIIIDSISLNAFFCNAGDNLVHIFRKKTGKMELIRLPQVSAAGVFPSDLIQMKGGFPVVKYQLEKGDVLFLYTDGIEESKRFFRDSEFEVMNVVKESNIPGGGEECIDNEELGMERVHRIIEAVFSKQKYILNKIHNPRKEELKFDFSSLDGSLEDAVMALVSVEKIFRIYKDFNSTEEDLVNVDKKVDSFLKRTFKSYDFYCGTKKEDSEHKEYLYYTGIKEDEQYDDLTILGIEIQ